MDEEGVVQGYWQGDPDLGKEIQGAVEALAKSGLPEHCVVSTIRW